MDIARHFVLPPKKGGDNMFYLIIGTVYICLGITFIIYDLLF